MSFIRTVEAEQECQIKDLSAFERALTRCGMVFLRDKKHFVAHLSHNGPQNKCAHAAGLPVSEQKTDYDKYEIGLVPSKKFEGTFDMTYDSYHGAIDKKCGVPGVNQPLSKLRMFYGMEAARNEAQRKDMIYSEIPEKNGAFTVRVSEKATIGESVFV